MIFWPPQAEPGTGAPLPGVKMGVNFSRGLEKCKSVAAGAARHPMQPCVFVLVFVGVWQFLFFCSLGLRSLLWGAQPLRRIVGRCGICAGSLEGVLCAQDRWAMGQRRKKGSLGAAARSAVFLFKAFSGALLFLNRNTPDRAATPKCTRANAERGVQGRSPWRAPRAPRRLTPALSC